nr:retrovirus-related Pol polyprotein from transposon TNT 1-94 [Tanacetum cinerariifolium]
AEAVNTACYVQNRVLVTKPHNKTPYELLHGRLPSIGFMRPFGCPVTILNTLDPLGKFQRKVDEGFLIGYSMCSSGPAWLFDIDSLTRTMNYHPVITENQTNTHVEVTRKQGDKTENKDKGNNHVVTITGFRDLNAEFEECTNNSSNGVNAASSSISIAGHNFLNRTNDFSAAGPSNVAASSTAANSSDMPNLEDLTHSNDADDVGAEADINNLESIISVSPIQTTRIHKDHLTSQIIGDLSSTTQTRSMARTVRDQGGISQMCNEDSHTCILPSIGFMRPFSCPVTILNTLDPLGKFQGKVDEGFLVGYSVFSKAFRVLVLLGFMRPFGCPVTILNTLDPLGKFQRKVDEAFLVGYSVCSSGPAWLFDIDSLSQTMNYHPVIAENQSNPNAEHDDDIQKYVSLDIHSLSSGAQTRKQGDKTENKDKGKSPIVTIIGFRDLNAEFKECNNNSSNGVNTASSSVSTTRQNSINSTNDFSAAGPSNAAMPTEDLSHSDDADDVGAEADINNLESIISVSPIPTTKIHKDHLTSQIISDLSSTTQTRSMARAV